MANKNDFKLLNLKCRAYFDLLESSLKRPISLRTEKHKERFGFYLFILETLCNIKDTDDLLELITDTEFNTDIFGIKDDDCGVDAIFIDDENNLINLFNFKFRDNYNADKKQSMNETFLTTKFTNAIKAENTTGLTGKIKRRAGEVIKKLNGNEIWRLRLYVASNETVELDTNTPEIKQLKQLYDLEVVPIGLDTISRYMSNRPKPIDATLHIDKDAILPYSENPLASSKSYVLKISASDLIRITCNIPEYRNDYGMENFSILSDVDMEYGLVFDNVRGLIMRSTFNDKILDTLKEEPSRFFMYNNGLTITASGIDADPTNANKKVKIVITDFQVVNGGQTLRTIHRFNRQDKDNITNYLSNCELLVRVFKTASESKVKNKIAEYTNSQNAISKIDLKSLSSEQIQIEQFLEEHNIIYARKIGDTGITPSRNYTHKISMEKFGQVLFALQGHPEKASNQKKQIFDKYYDSVFGEEYFDISKSAEYVNRYFEIKTEYDKSDKFESTDQKIFYILYLDGEINASIAEKIQLLENAIESYNIQDTAISDARKLIQIKFKDHFDNCVKEYISKQNS